MPFVTMYPNLKTVSPEQKLRKDTTNAPFGLEKRACTTGLIKRNLNRNPDIYLSSHKILKLPGLYKKPFPPSLLINQVDQLIDIRRQI